MYNESVWQLAPDLMCPLRSQEFVSHTYCDLMDSMSELRERRKPLWMPSIPTPDRKSRSRYERPLRRLWCLIPTLRPQGKKLKKGSITLSGIISERNNKPKPTVHIPTGAKSTEMDICSKKACYKHEKPAADLVVHFIFSAAVGRAAPWSRHRKEAANCGSQA